LTHKTLPIESKHVWKWFHCSAQDPLDEPRRVRFAGERPSGSALLVTICKFWDLGPVSGTTSSQNDAFARTPTICDTLGTLAISSGGVNDHDSKIISPAAPNIQNLNKKVICENHLFIQVSKPGSIMVILEHIFCVNPNTVRNQKWLKCNKY
jgi:hypothetical protein